MSRGWRQRYRQFVARNSTRRNRRLFVVVHYLSVAFFLTAAFTIDAALDYRGSIWTLLYWLSFVVAVVSMVAYWPIWSFLKSSIQTTESELDEDLDERQRMVRDRAYRSAYWILAYTCLYIGLYIAYVRTWATDRWSWLEGGNELTPVLLVIGVTYVVFTLSKAIIAWTEPDPEPEEVRHELERGGA